MPQTAKTSLSAFAALLAATLLLTACANERPQLNSERIEQRFGSYGIELLPGDDGLRRANLYSVADGVRTCRTYAVVRLNELPAGQAPPDLVAADRRVRDGASLGATLADAGWQVTKRSRYVGVLDDIVPVPRWVGLMRTPTARGLAVHFYELSVRKGGQTYDYAQIIEIYHPDYLGPADVRRLFPVLPADALGSADVTRLGQLLADPG